MLKTCARAAENSVRMDIKNQELSPLLVDVKGAGRLLGIKMTKVYDLFKTRELAFVKIGRSTRIEVSAIRDFIDRQRIGPKPPRLRQGSGGLKYVGFITPTTSGYVVASVHLTD